MTGKKEHMKWCKKRALDYLNRDSQWYSITNAVASMVSDLRKHEETINLIDDSVMGGLVLMSSRTHEDAERFIKGFPDF